MAPEYLLMETVLTDFLKDCNSHDVIVLSSDNSEVLSISSEDRHGSVAITCFVL